MKKFGYDKFLDPFINHLRAFEQDGIHIKALDNHLKGTVFCVCADNLAAHGLAGFQESFCVEKVFVDFALLANRTYIHCLFVWRNWYQKGTSLLMSLTAESMLFLIMTLIKWTSQTIDKTSFKKGSIGGNGHENWALLHLYGDCVPVNEAPWLILMDLRDIAEFVVCFLYIKDKDHQELLLKTFPDFKLKPKHHDIEH